MGTELDDEKCTLSGSQISVCLSQFAKEITKMIYPSAARNIIVYNMYLFYADLYVVDSGKAITYSAITHSDCENFVFF